jgi:hypothetical protein
MRMERVSLRCQYGGCSVERGEGNGKGEDFARREQGTRLEAPMTELIVTDSASKDGKSVICTNLPPECNEQIMSALYSQ